MEAEDESAMDQFLLQAVSENEPENVQPASTNDYDDLFLLDAQKRSISFGSGVCLSIV